MANPPISEKLPKWHFLTHAWNLNFWAKWLHLKWLYFPFLSMKPLSEVAPGLLVIQIQFQAVCLMYLYNYEYIYIFFRHVCSHLRCSIHFLAILRMSTNTGVIPTILVYLLLYLGHMCLWLATLSYVFP